MRFKFISVVILGLILQSCHKTDNGNYVRFSGVVLDNESKKPMENLSVSLTRSTRTNNFYFNGTKDSTITDMNGNYWFSYDNNEFEDYGLHVSVPSGYITKIVYDFNLSKPIINSFVNFDSLIIYSAGYLKMEISNVSNLTDTVALKCINNIPNYYGNYGDKMFIFNPGFHDTILMQTYFYMRSNNINLSLERNFRPSNPDTLIDSANIIFNRTVELLPKDTVTIHIDI